jgi:hypothetical protein
MLTMEQRIRRIIRRTGITIISAVLTDAETRRPTTITAIRAVIKVPTPGTPKAAIIPVRTITREVVAAIEGAAVTKQGFSAKRAGFNPPCVMRGNASIAFPLMV